jgi:hypothetical protein
MRERLRKPNTAFRKSYLRLFVDRVEVDDAEVRIYGPTSALARGVEEPENLSKGAVPTSVQDWRPLGDSNPCYRRERAIRGTAWNTPRQPAPN